MINKLAVGQLNQILLNLELIDEKLQDKSMVDFPKEAQLFSYKLLFTAVWIVFAIIESKRHPGISLSHPLPEARVISALHTLIQEFMSFDISPDSPETRTKTLDVNSAQELKYFMEQVAGAFMLFFSDFPNASDTQLVDWKNFDFTSGMGRIIGDAHNILLNKEPTTKGGFQLVELEAIRSEMTSRQKPFRYIERIVV